MKIMLEQSALKKQSFLIFAKPIGPFSTFKVLELKLIIFLGFPLNPLDFLSVPFGLPGVFLMLSVILLSELSVESK